MDNNGTMNLPCIEFGSEDGLISKAKETIRSGEGNFFRYVPVDKLNVLLEGGDIEYDGKTEYLTLIYSDLFRETVKPLNKICGAVASVLKNHFKVVMSDEEQEGLYMAEQPTMYLEELLFHGKSNLDSHATTSLITSVVEAGRKKDLSSIVNWLYMMGGDDLMINLKREGNNIGPAGIFSRLIPVSVGAPLLLIDSNKWAILEMDFDSDEFKVPPNDDANEHEVMVKKISMRNIRGIYGFKDMSALLKKLNHRYPNYFANGRTSDVYKFAREVPLKELLS